MTLFSLEGAIVQKAHSGLRSKISVAIAPMRKLTDTLNDPKKLQGFRAAFDKIENQLFEELKADAERDALKSFIATYDEVAALINASKARHD